MKREKTHEARDGQRPQPHKHEGSAAGPSRSKRRETRAGWFDLKSHKDWMFPLRRKAAAMAVALLAIAGCAENDIMPTPAQMIEGHWSGGAWAHETNLYYFHAGAMWEAKCDGGALFDRREYAYFFAGDTLKAVDVASGERYEYVCSFITPEDAVLERTGIDINLVRIR